MCDLIERKEINKITGANKNNITRSNVNTVGEQVSKPNMIIKAQTRTLLLKIGTVFKFKIIENRIELGQYSNSKQLKIGLC